MSSTTVSIIRAKCYLVLEGLENSLANNLKHRLPLLNEDRNFLSDKEKRIALARLRADLKDDFTLNDVRNEDLLVYLDGKDLVELLIRHKGDLIDVEISQISYIRETLRAHSIYGIRNRVMHPLRAIDADDLDTLMYVAGELRRNVPCLGWRSLDNGMRSSRNYQGSLDIGIPTYWAEYPFEDHVIPNNLPAGEFGDTGFVGREEERRRLKTLIDSYNRVVTVIGPGGTGKTALALRVCHELIENPQSKFDRIVWVTLKTKHLTADGIRDVTNAVSTEEDLLEALQSSIADDRTSQPEASWTSVLQEMEKSRILLVIDNLETLGRDIIDLADGIPPNSKLLLTSRVGLGEIERLYRIPELTPRDAGVLMRSLGTAYNCSAIKSLDSDNLARYCKNLHHSPLLLKWFVHAVNKGSSPNDVFAHTEMNQALTFCWRNVYQGLSQRAKRTIAFILASRRDLSRSELQEITSKLDHVDHELFLELIRELQQANIIESRIERDGTEIFQIGSLISDYLSRNHKPSGGVVKETRDLLRQLQVEQDARESRRGLYRYAPKNVHADTRGQRVAARYLELTLRRIEERNYAAAFDSLNMALTMEPTWWEVYRVRARLLEMDLRSDYEVEDAYLESIRYEDNDINRYHFAVYLMHNDSYDEALEHVEEALRHPDAITLSLRSIRGTILTRQNRYEEAIEEFEYVWGGEPDAATRLPAYVRKIQGTQFANCRRRQVEHLRRLGRGLESDTHRFAIDCASIISQTADETTWDRQLVDVGIRLLREIHSLACLTDLDPQARKMLEQELHDTSQKWDSDHRFRRCFNDRRVVQAFQRDTILIPLMKQTAKSANSLQDAPTFVGRITSVKGQFGFLECEALGSVYINPSSFRNRDEWADLRKGQLVSFNNVEPPMRSGMRPRAVFVDTNVPEEESVENP